jgi:hypothetical protein
MDGGRRVRRLAQWFRYSQGFELQSTLMLSRSPMLMDCHRDQMASRSLPVSP